MTPAEDKEQEVTKEQKLKQLKNEQGKLRLHMDIINSERRGAIAAYNAILRESASVRLMQPAFTLGEVWQPEPTIDPVQYDHAFKTAGEALGAARSVWAATKAIHTLCKNYQRDINSDHRMLNDISNKIEQLEKE